MAIQKKKYQPLKLVAREPKITDNLFIIGHPQNPNGLVIDDRVVGGKFAYIKKISSKCSPISGIKKYLEKKEFDLDSSLGSPGPIYNWDALFQPLLYGRHRLLTTTRSLIAFDTNCPTLPGMSGSPVFDQNYRVLGIVHGGLSKWVDGKKKKSLTRVIPFSEIWKKYRNIFDSFGITVDRR